MRIRQGLGLSMCLIAVFLLFLCCFIFNTIAIASPYGYVTNSESDNVSVIDIATNTVIGTIPTGDRPIGVAWSPLGTEVYVTNVNSGTVSVIDTITNTVTATIGVGTWPLGVGATPDGSRLYVSNMLSSSVSVIDTSTNMVIANIPVGGIPEGLVITPDGSKVYVPNGTGYYTSVISTATNTVIATIPTGNYAQGVAVNPDGTRVYIGNHLDHNVSVVDTSTNSIIATVANVPWPGGIVVDPTGTLVYAAGDRQVTIIDTGTNNVIGAIPLVPSGPQIPCWGLGISITPDGSSIYVAQPDQNFVSVFDTSNNSLITTIPVGLNPRAFGAFIGEPVPKPITIDIKPGSNPNSINLKSKGVVPVAVLTTEDFDASTIDPSTVKFAGASPLRWTMEDVDGDGDTDMGFHFETQELNLDEQSTEATLIGLTYGGMPFQGKDTVNIVPKGKGKEK